jgi:BirA family biotin operon repressor/biotin-[acetyl-CoA-carboxylase] ligase
MREGLPQALRTALGHLASRRPDLAFDVRWFDAVASTMDVAASAAANGVPAGFVALADRQTAGRGRRGRAWSSPAGTGLYFSYLARPTRRLELVTLAAGVGVREGITAATSLWPELKWPNDLLVGSRKLAGLLAEAHYSSAADASVVIGVGVNVEPGAFAPDVVARATSLTIEAGRDVSRFGVFVAVLEHLADALATLESGNAGDILRRWRDASPLSVGTAVSWTRNGAVEHGVTAGIDDAGALLVRTASGLERIVAGELQWQIPDS